MTTNTPLIFWVYRFLLFPLLWAIFFLLGFLNPKVKQGWILRKKVNGKFPWLSPPSNNRAVWIHAASGEFEYAKPLIRAIKKKFPQQKILVTFFTPSFVKAIQGFSGVDWVVPAPWDTPGSMAEFLAHHRPKCLLLARTDTWPEMIFQTHKRNIPIFLFSASINKNSRRFSGLLKGFYFWLFQKMNGIYLVNDTDKTFLEKNTPGLPLKVIGDTRFDQVIHRLNTGQKIKPLGASPEKLAVIAGSTWPEDEDILVQLLHPFSPWSWVLVPHEPTPEHLRDLERKIKQKGVAHCRYSKISEWDREKVLVVDQVGILAELYQKSDIAFVGGSFRGSVHSVMEPLAAGCLTVVGPHFENNSEAIQFSQIHWDNQTEVPCVSIAQHSEDLRSLLQWAQDQIALRPWRHPIQAKLQDHCGATQKLLADLKTQVNFSG